MHINDVSHINHVSLSILRIDEACVCMRHMCESRMPALPSVCHVHMCTCDTECRVTQHVLVSRPRLESCLCLCHVTCTCVTESCVTCAMSLSCCVTSAMSLSLCLCGRLVCVRCLVSVCDCVAMYV